jgi:uncharacterized SAM-binding protein YcdF (DUF218 family)
MDFIKKSVEIILSPLGITTILIALGIILSCTGKHSRAGRRLLISGGLLFLILLFSPLSEYLVLSLEREYPPMLMPPASIKINAIVVLAGYAEENKGFPITTNVSEQTVCSASEGLRIYRLLPGSKIILSGGVVREGEKSVAASMSELLQQIGVPARDIVIEGNSKNTYENLVEVGKIVGSRPFVLVAQALDMRRAMAIARKLHMNSIPAPSCHWVLQYHTNTGTREVLGRHLSALFYPSPKNLFRIQWAYHEYIGYWWYQLLGRI